MAAHADTPRPGRPGPPLSLPRRPTGRDLPAGRRWRDWCRLTAVALVARRLLAAGGLELDRLRVRLAVLAGVFDPGDRRVSADVARVDQVSGLAAEDVEAEVADRCIGHHRHRGLQLTPAGRLRFGPGHQVDLAVEDEGQFRQP